VGLNAGCMPSQGHCNCWVDNSSNPPAKGDNKRLHQLSTWGTTEDCCARRKLEDYTGSSFGGTTLGNCETHCKSISPDKINICVEIFKTLPDTHLVSIEVSVPNCLDVDQYEKRMYIDKYEYGRIHFGIKNRINNSNCKKNRELIEFNIRWTGSPTGDTDVRNMSSVQWTLDPIVHH
jgi:hypothetical protein